MFYDRLRLLCDQQNSNITDIAVRVLGVSNATPTNWKKGVAPKASVVIDAAKYFGVSTDYLLGLSNDPRPLATNSWQLAESEADLINGLRSASPSTRETVLRIAKAALGPVQDAVVSRPVAFLSPKGGTIHHKPQQAYTHLKHVEGTAAAGHPITAIPETDIRIPVPAKYLDDRYNIVRAQGDSMIDAGIDDGDFCVFDTEAYQDEGQIMLIRLEGSTDQRDMAIKRVYFHPGDEPDGEDSTVELRSENPAYAPMFYPASDAQVTGVLVTVIPADNIV